MMPKWLDTRVIRALTAVSYLLAGFLIYAVFAGDKPLMDRILLALVAVFSVTTAWLMQDRHGDDSYRRGLGQGGSKETVA